MDTRTTQLIQEYTNQEAINLKNKLVNLVLQFGLDPYEKKISVHPYNPSEKELHLLEKIYLTEIKYSDISPKDDYGDYRFCFGKNYNQKVKELEAELENVKKKFKAN